LEVLDALLFRRLLWSLSFLPTTTVFGATRVLEGFSFIIAIDWAMDRMRTSVNVTGDAFVTALVAQRVSEMGLSPDEAIPEGLIEGSKEVAATDTKHLDSFASMHKEG
jgi:Na+/H+-dicarboxylate symporter